MGFGCLWIGMYKDERGRERVCRCAGVCIWMNGMCMIEGGKARAGCLPKNEMRKQMERNQQPALCFLAFSFVL